MAEINRRKFLIASAGVGAAGVLSGAVAITLPKLLDAAHDRPLATDTGILVVVTLYGGNNGLSTLIPYTDNAYHDARPDLAYAPTDVLPLDGQLGLNPALKGLAKTWTDNKLAVVRGVGYPKPDRSHVRGVRGLPREQHHRCDIRAHRQGRRPDYGCSRAAGRRPGYLVKWRESAGS